jgi:hypothetical protein
MPTASTSTAVPTATATSTPTAMSGDCRDVRHKAKRAHRNACRQNAYRSLCHGMIPTRTAVSAGLTPALHQLLIAITPAM